MNRSSPIGAGERSCSLGPAAIVTAVLCALGALCAAGLAPAALMPFCGWVLLCGPVLWPLLARATPALPSWVKLGAVAWLLAPLFSVLVWGGLRAVLPERETGARWALVGTFLVCASLQWFGRGQRVRLERPGLATGLALLVGLLLVGLAGSFLWVGNGPRVSYHGLLHSAIALAADRQLPPENPWMAGTPLSYYWVWHALGALTARLLALAPTHALALWNLWAAAILPVCIQLFAAPLLRSRGREIAGLLFALFGLGAVSGWVWLQQGAVVGLPRDALALFAEMARGVPESAGGVPLFDRRLAYGFSKFGNINSYPTALALSVGGWFAAAHALRHGVAPWPLLVGLLHGGATLFNPLVGLVAVVPTAAALLWSPRRALVRTAVALGIGLVPGLWLTQAAASAYGGETVALALDGGAWAGAVLPLAPLLLLAAGAGLSRGARVDLWAREGGRRNVALLCAFGALLPLLLSGIVRLPYDNQYKLVRMAALPLGLWAGAGALGLWSAGGWRRGLALFGLVFLGGGAVLNEWRAARAYGAFAKVELPLLEGPLFLGPVESGPGADVAAAYRYLREHRPLRERRAVLLLDSFESTGYAYGDPPTGFVGLRNLQGHEAPAFAALDLWVDRPSQVLDARTVGREQRELAAVQLLRSREALLPEQLELLRGIGRPIVVLVAQRDWDAVLSLEHRLRWAGFGELWRQGSAALFVYPHDGVEAPR